MDAVLKGHPYVKTAIDMAAWDLLGKATGVPVCTLLGGRFGDDFPLYRAISQEEPAAMAARVATYRAEGYTRFQLKVGGAPDVDVERIEAARTVLDAGELLIADANTGWLMHDAAAGRSRGVRDVDVYDRAALCELRGVPDHPPADRPPLRPRREHRRHSHRSCAAHADGAMDAVNIKISKFGGLTRARQARDLCVAHWGSR